MAHALLQQLIKYDYARPVGYERRYVQGSGLVLLGSRVRAGLQIVKVARPIIEEIAAATGRRLSRHPPFARDRVRGLGRGGERRDGAFSDGSLRPLRATSPGKLFLAFHVPPAQLETVLGAEPLVAFTRYTTTDRSALVKQLDQVRARGYAVNEQEAVDGAFGISAPIFGADRALAGSLTIGVPGTAVSQRPR